MSGGLGSTRRARGIANAASVWAEPEAKNGHKKKSRADQTRGSVKSGHSNDNHQVVENKNAKADRARPLSWKGA